jgi:hypothetical protein
MPFAQAMHLPTRMTSSLLRTSPSSSILRCHARPHRVPLFRPITSSSSRPSPTRIVYRGDDGIQSSSIQTGQVPPGQQKPGSISLRPLFFSLGVCVASFYVADLIGRRSDSHFLQTLAKSGWTSGDSHSAKLRVESMEKQQTLAWLQQIQAPGLVKDLYAAGKNWWARQSDGQRAVVVIIALNTLPFLAWRIPVLQVQKFMQRSFTEWPGVHPSYTLLTSVFSHEVRNPIQVPLVAAAYADTTSHRVSCISASTCSRCTASHL